MKTKTFDCVEMKRRGAEAVRRHVASMTAEQELAFWQERSERLRKRQQEFRARHNRAAGWDG